VEASYTAGSRTITNELIGLSKNSFNVVGFYEKGPLSTRLSYVWRDRYLSNTGSTTQPVYTAAFGSLDGSIAFRVNGNVTLSLEAINIAKAKQYTYNDRTVRFGEINDYGRTILFGARAEF
jgi:outer membrane receptor for monomeric catechols